MLRDHQFLEDHDAPVNVGTDCGVGVHATRTNLVEDRDAVVSAEKVQLFRAVEGLTWVGFVLEELVEATAGVERSAQVEDVVDQEAEDVHV